MRPSIIAEWQQGHEWTRAERATRLLKLHDEIFNHYNMTLTGGETQILSKIKPLWEYFGSEFDRKSVKRIGKANTISSYRMAVMQLS